MQPRISDFSDYINIVRAINPNSEELPEVIERLEDEFEAGRQNGEY